MDKVLRGIGLAVLTFSFFLAFNFLWSLLVRWAWNSTMPQIFGLIEINYWQAYALTILGGLTGQKIHQEIKD